MSLTKKHIKFIQKQLQQAGKNPGPDDGVFGKKTRQALLAAGMNPGLSNKRIMAQYIQALAE
ncbi:MAG: peptidoglycan-binding protein, partial [Ketobacter sp.]